MNNINIEALIQGYKQEKSPEKLENMRINAYNNRGWENNRIRYYILNRFLGVKDIESPIDDQSGYDAKERILIEEQNNQAELETKMEHEDLLRFINTGKNYINTEFREFTDEKLKEIQIYNPKEFHKLKNSTQGKIGSRYNTLLKEANNIYSNRT